MSTTPNAWIVSARFDGIFILAPAVLVSFIALFFHQSLESLSTLPPWLWLLLIVGVDAGHVYGTLFRTYFVKEELEKRQTLLTLTPLFVWLVSCLLYSIGSMPFWRVLAYLAVFHFMRQQYGFMMIYSRGERNQPGFYRSIDKAAIYAATLYPLVYWHCHERAFDWFVPGDFFTFAWQPLSQIAAGLYWAVLTAYALKEYCVWQSTKTFNLPKNLWLLGTALSWYVGIVALNNDFIFTALNVIAHGVPYLALTWAYGRNETALHKNAYIFTWLSKVFNWKTVPLFIAIMSGLAFFEEGLWDGFVWREHGTLFGVFQALPAVSSQQTLMWLVPLLSLPQATHYVLDAFIWRLHVADTGWKQVLFYHQPKTD